MNLTEIKDMIMFEAVVGSQAYNLSTPESDIDIRGIFAIPMSKRFSPFRRVEEVGDDKQDVKYYELEKFFTLASQCNPNIIEILWSPEECIKVKTDKAKMLLKNRHLFISKRAYHTFSGYAYAQIQKCKGQNKWINNPQPKDPPKKEDFCWVIRDFQANTGIPFRPAPLNFAIKKGLVTTLDQYHVAALEHVSNTYRLYYYGDKAKGVFRNGQLVCESIPLEEEYKCDGLLIYNEHEYEKALTQWKQYWDWIKNRNPARWKLQETGIIDYDTKNMMHCLRLLYSGKSILEYGFPIVRFEGDLRDFLFDVRNGKFLYDDLMKIVDREMNDLKLINEKSTIPHHANVDKLEELFNELIF